MSAIFIIIKTNGQFYRLQFKMRHMDDISNILTKTTI